MNDEYLPFDDDEEEIISKSQIKKEMQALQEMGESLLAMKKSQRDTLPLSTKLHLALEETLRITHKNARRRHMQYIGKLMREVDMDALQARLNEIQEQGHRSARQQPFIEEWTRRLVEEDNQALQEFIEQYPQCDIQKLRQFIRQAKKEQAEGKTQTQRKKLFQHVRGEMD